MEYVDFQRNNRDNEIKQKLHVLDWKFRTGTGVDRTADAHQQENESIAEAHGYAGCQIPEQVHTHVMFQKDFHISVEWCLRSIQNTFA